MKRLLVVDDYEDFHDIIKLVFEDDEIEINCLTHMDGFDETISQFQPHLVILDVNIGNEDGREVCNQLKAEKTTQHIKVLLTSATTMDFMNYQCKPDGYFYKPFSVDDLRNLVLGNLEV